MDHIGNKPFGFYGSSMVYTMSLFVIHCQRQKSNFICDTYKNIYSFTFHDVTRKLLPILNTIIKEGTRLTCFYTCYNKVEVGT